jgi:hypothetical protein
METLEKDEEIRTIRFKIFKNHLNLEDLLCRAIHEQDEDSLDKLTTDVINIEEI